jgi:hypothetical protein
MTDTNGMFANDFHILPGQWRPQCPWEHIAWISPPWPSQYYLWLDLPETVFCGPQNFFLSHINDHFPPVFQDLPKVNWTTTPAGVSVRRRLPNGIEFGVLIEKRDEISVSLRLNILNGSDTAMGSIRTQTCAYLRGLKEFSDCTRENKHVCISPGNWVQLEQCGGRSDYREGSLALPVIITRSNQTSKLIAMSWFEHTGPIWDNMNHPCMHADPCFPDLEPGESKTVCGLLVFFEGTVTEFEEWFRAEGAKRHPI